MKEKAKLEEEKKDEEKEDPKGIPEFWLTVFKNVDLLSDMLQVGASRQLPRRLENGSQTRLAPSKGGGGKIRFCFHLLARLCRALVYCSYVTEM